MWQRGPVDPSSLTPLPGGWSGLTFLAEAAGERSVVRVYPPGRRDDAAPEIDAAVLGLVRGLVPVPDVLEVRRGSREADLPGLLVTSFVAGERADVVLDAVDDAGAAALGRAVGALAADLAGMPTLRPGPFVDAGLAIGDFDVPDGLPGFVASRSAELGWESGPLRRLTDVAVRAQALLDTVGRSCLVHSDLNPKNLLVEPASGEVAALLDWEYAHSGHPCTDLGNALRFDRRPAYAAAVLDAWCERRGTEPRETLDLARAADLWALVDLAARASENPVAERAAVLLREVARTGDLHASPAAP